MKRKYQQYVISVLAEPALAYLINLAYADQPAELYLHKPTRQVSRAIIHAAERLGWTPDSNTDGKEQTK